MTILTKSSIWLPRISRRRIRIVRKVARENDIPADLLLGVLTIEMTYRTVFHRAVEYTLSIVSALICAIAGLKMRNYTISYTQLGITSILTYYGQNHYIHSKHISRFKITWLKYLLHTMCFETSVKICAEKLRSMHYVASAPLTNMSMLYRRIGYDYNGHWIYGIMLDNICKTLRTSSIIA